MIKKVIKLAVFLAIVFAAYKTIPQYVKYVQFRDEIAEVARFSGGRTEKELRPRIAEIIERRQIPLDPDAVIITSRRDSTAIDASYVQRIELLPTYFYNWKFDVKVDQVHIRPTSPDAIR